MTLPVPSEMTATVGAILTAAQWNSNVRDGVNFLANPPIFVGYQTVAQSIPNNTLTSVLLDSESVDTYNGHSNSSNTSRYVAPVPGWWLYIAQMSFTVNTSGARIILPAINGSTPTPQLGIRDQLTSQYLWQSAGLVHLNAGDYLEAQVLQTSGAALSTSTTGGCALAAIWIHA